MKSPIDAVWTTTSPYLKRFDQPLLKQLRQHITIAQWQYQQTEDEPSSLEIAVDLLHEFIQQCERPVHLIGHGTGGLVSLLYTRQRPSKVRSLTLLGVGAWASLDWIAHYYFHLQFVPCSRHHVLAQMVPDLFGEQNSTVTCFLAKLLEKELAVSPSPHSLFRHHNLSPGGVSVPLFLCGSKNDPIVDSNALKEWESWIKECDRIWQCHDGHHFFHCFYPQAVAAQILNFWKIQSRSSFPNNRSKSCPV